jgi:hypothetical protein
MGARSEDTFAGKDAMPRFSIFKAMLVIALIAGNFAAVRALNPMPISPGILPLLLTGLVPLVDAQIIGLYVIARRYRFALRHRTGTGHGVGVFVFVIFNALALIILLAACVVAPEGVADQAGIFLDPFGRWLRSLGYGPSDFEAPFFQFFVIPSYVAAVLSGPPLLLGSIFGRLVNGYELVIARRLGQESAPSQARADTTEPQIEQITA